jgi:signal transduction histidine kinase
MLIGNGLKSYKNNNPLAIKLLTYIVLCSSFITLLATGSQLYIDYTFEIKAIDDGIKQIENSSLATLENSLWEISPEQIQLQLDGLNKLRDIEYITLHTPFNEHYASGTLPNTSVLEKQYQLKHIEDGKAYQLGTLRVIISLDKLYQRLWDKALLILLSQGVKTFLVSIFILSIFYHLVTQHLALMAKYSRALQLSHNIPALALARRDPAKPDELNNVVDSFNIMKSNMQNDFEKRIKAEQALEQLNSELEHHVQQRTKQLQIANDELSSTLENLQLTQNQLIESKKMASLGNLVAGVAHEISTPIGIGYTAASYLEQQAKQHSGDLSDIAIESSQMICKNLERAASLVTAFKQVSVDQSTEKSRHFKLANYLDEILLSLKPRLRDKDVTIAIKCNEELELYSYPGSFYQIFNNLIINSLIHGSKEEASLHINIEVDDSNAEHITINYIDNGIGLNQQWLRDVFEPFATSKRGQGCSGLGMHISYNIITQRLKGTIHCIESTEGAHFRIRLTKTIAD